MTDFAKLMTIVGVLSLVMGVLSIVGSSPVPGGFFLLMGLACLGSPIAERTGILDDMVGDFDKMVGGAGLVAAMGIGLAWLGMAGFSFNNSRVFGADGHPDAHLWWGIIGTLLSIAAIGALVGGVIHFRQERNP